MFASGHAMRGSIFKGFFVLAGAAGIVPAAALAAECKLSVHASPQVLWGDQDTHVDVLAHFPSLPAPDGAYAFASSEFDVYASDPMWTLVSAGAIVGNDVLGISADQAHAPQLGDPADASNPIRVWHGVFEPQSDAPALIEIEADPADFFVYPSKLTSSSAECDAVGGSDFVFVNPLRVGRWLAAPGAGTEVRTGDDVIVDGRIITGENPAGPVRIGMLHPAIQKIPVSSTRVEFDGEPESFTATVQVKRGDAVPTTQFSLNFQKIEFRNSGQLYVLGANFSFADGSGPFFAFDGFLGGVHVASGELDGNLQIADLMLTSLPQTFEVRARRGKVSSSYDDLLGAAVYGSRDGGSTSAGDLGIWQDNYGTTLRYDQPVVAIVRGANGNPLTVTLDRIEVRVGKPVSAEILFVEPHGGQAPAASIRSQHNLRQLSLGCHVFTAEGVQQMRITPGRYW